VGVLACVDVQGTKILHKPLLPLRAYVLEVMVMEDDAAAFRDQQRDIVLFKIIPLAVV